MDSSPQNESKRIFEECRDKFIQNLEDNQALDKAAKVLLEEIDALETKHFQKDGIVTDQRDVIAHGPRLKAIELLVAIYGLKAPEKSEIKHGFDEPLIEIVRKLRAEREARK